MLPVGKSDEHLAFPGTLTLSAETLGRLWTEIGESVARAGVRKLVLFNSHGGQPQVMEIVARDLRVRLGMLAVAYSWYAAGVPPGLFADEEVRLGIHAGAIETSMMLHLRPDLVRMDARGRLRAADGRDGGARLSPPVADRARQARLAGAGPAPGRAPAAMRPTPMPSAAARWSSTPRRRWSSCSPRSTAIRSRISGPTRAPPKP